jgi:hypothetical protein
MLLELIAAAGLGGLVLWLLVGPLVSRAGNRPTADASELDDVIPPEETRRGQALIALKDLEFDLALGKLADADYQMLRERFVGEALDAMRADAAETAPPLDTAEARDAIRAAATAPPLDAAEARDAIRAAAAAPPLDTAEARDAIRAAAAAPPLDAAEALVAARAAAVAGEATGPGCPSCGPRPEADALFCSDCGRGLTGEGACARCGEALTNGARFCPSCGARAAALV